MHLVDLIGGEALRHFEPNMNAIVSSRKKGGINYIIEFNSKESTSGQTVGSTDLFKFDRCDVCIDRQTIKMLT